VGEQQECEGCGPVEVVRDEQKRSTFGEGGDQGTDGVEEPPSLSFEVNADTSLTGDEGRPGALGRCRTQHALRSGENGVPPNQLCSIKPGNRGGAHGADDAPRPASVARRRRDHGGRHVGVSGRQAALIFHMIQPGATQASMNGPYADEETACKTFDDPGATVDVIGSRPVIKAAEQPDALFPRGHPTCRCSKQMLNLPNPCGCHLPDRGL
jgi:hypothetical protein